MIDILIIKIAKWISTKILPSNILKLMIVILILSLILSVGLGTWVIILALVVNQVVWILTEFLYTKDVEDAE